MKDKTDSLLSQFKEVFKGFNPDDKNNHSITLQTGSNNGGNHHARSYSHTESGSASTQITSQEIDFSRTKLSDLDRSSRYKIYEDMIEEPIFDCAIDMHLSHALSVDSKNGQFITFESLDPSYDKMVAELNIELGRVINEYGFSWSKLAATFGVHYIRPYAEVGKGITHIESSYYTLATHIREYERSGMLAGFTSEHFIEQDTTKINLADPWSLVAVKIPVWRPKLSVEPINLSGERYSLYDDAHHRTPVERQNYGTSLLHGAFEPWLDMRDGLASLRGSRSNSGKITRLVTVGMEGLTPMAAAQQTNLVGAQLKADIKSAEKNAKQKGKIPTILTSILPSIAGGKNGITVDTHSVSPDIQHIEDIMFHLKRGVSAIGLDVSLLGWGDLMSGGLGDGGFFRTSIQAAQRANLLRQALMNAVHRLIDIHLVYKTGKAFSSSDRPYKIVFNSLNTAIEQEHANSMLNRSEYASSVATALDMVEQSTLSKSPTFKKMFMTDMLQLDDELTDKIMKEMKSEAESSGDENMFESLNKMEQLARQAAKNEISRILEGE